MEFCPKCGKMLVPKEENGEVYLVCPVCGFRKKAEEDSYVTTEKKKEEHEGVAVNAEKPNLPVTSARCPKCGNDKAYFWTEQTRAADEPQTRFYKCTKCGYVWREYS